MRLVAAKYSWRGVIRFSDVLGFEMSQWFCKLKAAEVRECSQANFAAKSPDQK